MQRNNKVEPWGNERATWLSQVHATLAIARRAAQDLLAKPESATEARILLARLAVIQIEIDALGQLPPVPWPTSFDRKRS